MAVEAGGLTNSPMLEQVFVNPDHSSQVLYQLSELWRDKKLCDATIEVGPVKVYVHRLVLLAACPYLLTVGGQHEVSILEVKLPMTVGLEGLNIFLTYLYDGVLHLTTANLRSVEKLAKILKVASIQKFCQEFRDANRETGAADKLTTDYSLKMTNSSLQIIFAEIQTGELKRESADLESDVVPIKRPRMNLDMLSAALQKKSSQSVPSDSFRDTNRGHSGVGATDELFHTDRHRGEGDSTIDTVTGLVRVKDEPVSDYEEEDDEDDDAGYGDEDSELQGYGTTTTDFVRQAPYDTRPFPDDGMNTSGSKMVVSLPPPPSLQKRPGRKRKQLPSGAQHTAQTSTSDADVSFTKGADASETEEGSVDATKVLKNIVKAMPEMAMNLGTSSEIGDDNKPSFGDEDWAMYMVRPLAQKKKTRMELPLEKKIELIREYQQSPKPRQKIFAVKYGLGRSTVSDILKKSDFYMRQFEENADLNKRRFHNSCKFEQLNRFMWNWYLEARARGIPVSGTLIQERALKYSQELRIPDFKASNGWLQSWKSRYSIKSFKVSSSDSVRSRVDIASSEPQDGSTRIEVLPHVLDTPATGVAPPMPPGVASSMMHGAQDSSKIGLMPASSLYSEHPVFPTFDSVHHIQTSGPSGDGSETYPQKPTEESVVDDEVQDEQESGTSDAEEESPDTDQQQKQELPSDEYSPREKSLDSQTSSYLAAAQSSYHMQASYLAQAAKDFSTLPKDYRTQASPEYHITPSEFDLHAKHFLETHGKEYNSASANIQAQTTDVYNPGSKLYKDSTSTAPDTETKHFRVQPSMFGAPYPPHYPHPSHFHPDYHMQLGTFGIPPMGILPAGMGPPMGMESQPKDSSDERDNIPPK